MHFIILITKTNKILLISKKQYIQTIININAHIAVSNCLDSDINNSGFANTDNFANTDSFANTDNSVNTNNFANNDNSANNYHPANNNPPLHIDPLPNIPNQRHKNNPLQIPEYKKTAKTSQPPPP